MNPTLDRRHAIRQRLPIALAATLTVASFLAASGPSAQAHPTQRAASAPCIPAGHGPGVIPSFTFGRTGGNIRPMQVSIYGDGAITYQGATPVVPNYAISPNAVLGLQRLAGAEGFWSLPGQISGARVLPDIATQFITVRAGCSTITRTVQSHGGDDPAFAELFDTLTAATAISVATAPPAAVPGPSAVTPANDGQTLQYAVGQRFLLDLGTGYQWSFQLSAPGIFERVRNIAVIVGAQGVYTATTPGQTTLTATGTPDCRSSQPACATPSRQVTVQLVVSPHQ